MKESNGELVPVQVVPVKTVEGKIEHKTQEEMTEGLAFGENFKNILKILSFLKNVFVVSKC